MEYFFIFGIWVLLLGLCIGSFLNVCIYRIPAGESIVAGRSHCTACGKAIKPYDLIPVISYVFLAGRCRNCGARISPRYPLIELLNTVLYLTLFYFYKFSPAFFIYAALASTLIVAAFIDIDKGMIPDRIHVFLLVIGVLACLFSPDIVWYERIIGLFAASAPLFIAMLLSKGGMGFGDVKLAAAAGLIIGYKLALLSLLAACIIGSVYGIIYAVIKGKSLKTAIPFGPFLAIAFYLSLLFGNTMISAYLRLFYK
jgi:leader peptidase (prepilin peptidase)/N-methyltransferase